jgi:hypothetical protein
MNNEHPGYTDILTGEKSRLAVRDYRLGFWLPRIDEWRAEFCRLTPTGRSPI